MTTVRSLLRASTRAGAVGALALGGVLLGASPASAHVTVTPSTTAAGAYSVLTFAWAHGCDASPTTQVTVQIPDGVYSVSPTRHPSYSVEKVMETLDEPVDDGHGGEYTERVAQIVYTATTPLPEGYRDAVELSLQLPEGEAGDVVEFPTIQTCEQGETAWIDETVEGEPEPETPAPTVTLTAGGDGNHGHAADEASDAAEASDGGSSAVAWTGVGLGALGLVAGGAALARSGTRA